ncbi:MAG: MNIO family bufferin maturase [Methylobacter sp.]
MASISKNYPAANPSKRDARNALGLPNLGFGVGLRNCHYQDALRLPPREVIGQTQAPDWFEVISENYMDDHGHGRSVLRRIAERYPVVFHGVSLSIGSSGPVDEVYLQRLKQLAEEIPPAWVSDHLCWTGINGINSHDLLPMPLHQQSLSHVISRVHHVQERLGRPLILENPSSYLHYAESDIPEWEFLNELTRATGAGLLLDVNNVYVSAFNLGFDAEHYIQNIAHERVVQIHLAGPTHCGTHIIDTHDRPVLDRVWQLYASLLQLTGEVSTLLEWDANIPPFPELLCELDKARRAAQGELPPLSGEAEASVDDGAAVLSTPLDFMLQEER